MRSVHGEGKGQRDRQRRRKGNKGSLREMVSQTKYGGKLTGFMKLNYGSQEYNI